MLKTLPVLCFALLGYAGSAHPIKMTTSKMTYDAKTGQLVILINFFADDFNAHLAKVYKQKEVNAAVAGETEKRMTAAYVAKKFIVKFNQKQQPLVLNTLTKIEDNVVQARFIIPGIKGQTVRLIEVYNELLFDAFNEQANIMHVNLIGKDNTNTILQFMPRDSYKVIKTIFTAR